jgi:hypothetical protein
VVVAVLYGDPEKWLAGQNFAFWMMMDRTARELIGEFCKEFST